MDQSHMQRFWNARAREDPLFFIDDRRAYGDRDEGGFWVDGERDLEHLLSRLEVGVDRGATVLDLGCGIGRLTRPLAARAQRVLALDVSSEMIELARRLHEGIANITWILGDGRTLSAVDAASIDLCVSHVVFQHIPDPAITLGYVTEIGRVLAAGGVAAVQFSNDPTVHRPHRAHASWRRRVGIRLGRVPHGQDDPAWLGGAIELADLERAAAVAGMTIERVVGERTRFCATRLRKTPSPA